MVTREISGVTRIARGYTPAERWVVHFSDGASAFAKVGASPLTAGFLRDEARVYRQLSADFMPQLLGFEDDPERPLLLLEDLSAARWPPPWEPGDLERLSATLERVAASQPMPDQLPALTDDFPRSGYGWLDVAHAPEPFLALGLCSKQWLVRALPRLLEAQAAAVLEGDALVHGDLRSDNLCLFPERVVLVDWNGARRGNIRFNLAFLAPSVRLEGGPPPEELAGEDPPFAALVSGYFAGRAGLPVIPDAPKVRWIQLRQLRIALPWAVRALGLDTLDLPWARTAIAGLDAERARGSIDEVTWRAQVDEVESDASASI